MTIPRRTILSHLDTCITCLTPLDGCEYNTGLWLQQYTEKGLREIQLDAAETQALLRTLPADLLLAALAAQGWRGGEAAVAEPAHVDALLPPDVERSIAEHFRIETALRTVTVYTNATNNAYLLVEVSDDAIPTGAVEPFYFAPNEECPVPLYVANVTHEEAAHIGRAIPLPQGWTMPPIQVVHRPLTFCAACGLPDAGHAALAAGLGCVEIEREEER